MCSICDNYDNGSISGQEAVKLLTEAYSTDSKHLQDAVENILSKEVKFEDTFSEDVLQYDSEDI